MVVNLSYSFIPFQKVSQKGVDRSVENPQMRAENIEMAPNAPNKLSWRMRNKMPLILAEGPRRNPGYHGYKAGIWRINLPR